MKNLYAERLELFIEDQAFSRSYDLASPQPHTPLDRHHTGRLRKRYNLMTGDEGRGWARSIQQRESLIVYKSFNTLCKYENRTGAYRPHNRSYSLEAAAVFCGFSHLNGNSHASLGMNGMVGGGEGGGQSSTSMWKIPVGPAVSNIGKKLISKEENLWVLFSSYFSTFLDASLF